MRALELLLILAILTAVLWPRASLPKARSFQIAIPVTVLAVALFQLAIEGYRWQMVPAYLAVPAIFISILHPDSRFAMTRFVGIVGAVTTSSIAAIVYPVFQLPRPTGPYSVGTVTYHLTDTDRTEVFGTVPGGPRELMVQLWYPADAGGSIAPKRYSDPNATAGGIGYLKFVRTHAFRGIRIANTSAGFPVILFTPSWHGVRNQETAVVEDLVSHGFVVAGVDHPYGSGMVIFPDGRKISARKVSFMDTSSDVAMRESVRAAEQEVRVRALDLVFVLNQLAKINHHDALGILTGRFDLSRVGILGYSFGGAVAVEACWLDRRFRCAIDLDGALFGQASVEGIAQPLLVMTDSARLPSVDELTSPQASRRRYAAFLKEQVQLLWQDMKMHGGYLMEISEIAHSNFSDDALLSPLRWLTGAGRIGRYRAITIVRSYSVAFFKRFLNGTPQPLLRSPSLEFPEVKLTVSKASYESSH